MMRRFLLLALLAAAAPPAALATPELALRYDVYYLAFRVVAIDAVSRVEPAAYRANVMLRTTGVLGAIMRWASSATATGMVDGPLLRPAFYGVRSEFRDRRQQIDLEYGDGGAVRAQVEGVLTDGARDDVPEPLRTGTIDPLTAGIAVSHQFAATGRCDGTLRVFDGLRRYDLRYVDLGVTELEPSRRDAYRGPARHCRATVERLAGFLQSGEGARDGASELSAWLAPPLPGVGAVAVRLDLKGQRGTLHIHLSRAGLREG